MSTRVVLISLDGLVCGPEEVRSSVGDMGDGMLGVIGSDSVGVRVGELEWLGTLGETGALGMDCELPGRSDGL